MFCSDINKKSLLENIFKNVLLVYMKIKTVFVSFVFTLAVVLCCQLLPSDIRLP